MMTEQSAVGEVPLVLRLFGWFLIVGGVESFVSIVVSGWAFSAEPSAWNATSKALAAVSGYGFLKTRRWAVYLYFTSFALNTALFYLVPPSQEALAAYSAPSALAALLLVPTGAGVLSAYYWRRLS